MNGGGLAVGRLFGIEIRVSFAWAVLIAIVTLIGAEQAAVIVAGPAPRRRSGRSAPASPLASSCPCSPTSWRTP